MKNNGAKHGDVPPPFPIISSLIAEISCSFYFFISFVLFNHQACGKDNFYQHKEYFSQKLLCSELPFSIQSIGKGFTVLVVYQTGRLASLYEMVY